MATRRERVQARLRKIRARVARLVNWEKRRDRITQRRRVRYRRVRDAHGDNDPRTIKALRAYRRSLAKSRKIDETEEVLRQRAENKIRWLREHPPGLDPDGDDLIQIDGKQISEGVGREVLRIRKAGRWKGVVVSGYRTPEHSEQLCFSMCGRPSCPGRCAGRATNHARKGGRSGAVDLTDFITFRQECWRLGSWLENRLPGDLVHFSDAGN